jgi:hypothetical protein
MLDPVTANAAATNAIAAAVSQTLDALTLQSEANGGAAITAELNATLESLTLAATADSGIVVTDASGYSIGRNKRRRAAPVPKAPQLKVVAGLDVRLDAMTCNATATMGGPPTIAARRRRIKALLLAA